MKANRKAINNDEEAVSPVIAVILMVAITVVLAATVFVLVNELGADIGETGPNLGLTTASSATNSTQWTIKTTSATDSVGFGEYTYTLTADASTYTNSSWDAAESDPAAVLFITDSTNNNCYRLALVTSGSELGVGERLQIRYQENDAVSCANTKTALEDDNWTDDPEDLPTNTHEIELIHRASGTNSGSISRTP